MWCPVLRAKVENLSVFAHAGTERFELVISAKRKQILETRPVTGSMGPVEAISVYHRNRVVRRMYLNKMCFLTAGDTLNIKVNNESSWKSVVGKGLL